MIDGKRPLCGSAEILKIFGWHSFWTGELLNYFIKAKRFAVLNNIECTSKAKDTFQKKWRRKEISQQLVFPYLGSSPYKKLSLLGRCSSFSPLGVLLLHCACLAGSVCCGPEWIKQTVVKVSLICITSRQPCRTLCWQEITVFVTFFQWSPFGRDWPCDQD